MTANVLVLLRCVCQFLKFDCRLFFLELSKQVDVRITKRQFAFLPRVPQQIMKRTASTRTVGTRQGKVIPSKILRKKNTPVKEDAQSEFLLKMICIRFVEY